jgi:hypothetical protein
MNLSIPIAIGMVPSCRCYPRDAEALAEAQALVQASWQKNKNISHQDTKSPGIYYEKNGKKLK